jgi:hypothetical protein
MISTTTTTTVTTPSAGSNVAVPFPQRFDEEEHLVLYRVTSAGVRTTLTEGVHYSVAGTGNEAGGTITVFTVAAGDTIIASREVDITQQQDYVTNDRFPAAGTEGQLDKQIMIDQQLNNGLGRAIKVLPGEPNPVVSARADREETIMVWDNNGDYTEDTPAQLWSRLPVPTGPISGVGMKTWADDAARANATYAPDFVGQVGTQIDTLNQYVGTGVTAGDWKISTLWPTPVTTEAGMLAALASIGTADGGFTITESFALTANRTIPENVSTHWIVPGAMIDTAGFTLELDGSVNAAPNQQIFENFAAGDVFGQFGGSDRHVGWWGAKADFDGGGSCNFSSSGSATVAFTANGTINNGIITPPAAGRDVTFKIPTGRGLTKDGGGTLDVTGLDLATDIFTYRKDDGLVYDHGFNDGDMVKFITSVSSGTDVLPPGSNYSLGQSLTKVHPFEINVLSTSTFKVKKDSNIINITGVGQGTVTIVPDTQTFDTIASTVGAVNFNVGDVIVVSNSRDDVDITLTHGTGNLSLTGAADVVLDTINKVCALKWSGTAWEQVAITEASVSSTTYTDSTLAIQSAIKSGKNGLPGQGAPSGTGVVRLGAGRYLISGQLDMRQTSCILAGLGYYTSTIYVDDRDAATDFPDNYVFILGNMGGAWGDYMTGIQDVTVRFRDLPQATVGMAVAKDDIGEPTWIKRVFSSHCGAEYVRIPDTAQCMNFVLEDCHFGSIKHYTIKSTGPTVYEGAPANVYIGAGTYTAFIKRNTFNSQQVLGDGRLPSADGVICRGFNTTIDGNHFEDHQHNINVQANATYCNVTAVGNHSASTTIPVKITGIDDSSAHRNCSVDITGLSIEAGHLGGNRTINVAVSDMQVGHFRLAEHGAVINYSRKRLGKGSLGTAFYCKGNITPVNSAVYEPPNLATHSKTGILPAAINTTRNSIYILNNTLRQNDRVQLEVEYVLASGGRLPAGYSAFQCYFVNLIENNEITLSEYPGGPVVGITDQGTGTFNVILRGGNICRIKDIYADRKALTGATTTTDQININNHMFWHTMPVRVIKGTGALPTGLSENTQYYVLEVDDNEFSLSLTPGGAAVSITSGTGGTTTYIEPTGHIIADPAWDVALIDDAVGTGGSKVNLGEIYWNETELLPAPAGDTWFFNGISDLEGKELRIRAYSVLRDVCLLHGMGQSTTYVDPTAGLTNPGITNLYPPQHLKHGIRTSNSRDITLIDNDQVIILSQNSAGRWLTPDSTQAGATILGRAPGSGTAVGIAVGVLTITESYHTITPEGGVGAGADAVTSIVGGIKGQLIVLSPTTSGAADTITITDGGNIHCAGNFAMDHVDDTITLLYTGVFWQEVSRSDNA